MRFLIHFKWILLALMSVFGQFSHAEDIFNEKIVREITPKSPLVAGSTIGGYAIPPGENKWVYFNSTVTNATGAGDIVLGKASWLQWEGAELMARLNMTVNLNQGQSSSWNGTPCSPTHLVVVNKGSGRYDNCLTIDAVVHKVGTREVTMLSLKMTNTASNGRYYFVELMLNPALLGFRETAVVDWTPPLLKVKVERQEFIDRLTVWATNLQEASMKAFAYEKPQDAYAKVESWQTLLSVPSYLKDKNHSRAFISVANDLAYRSGFKAAAYANYGEGKTLWRASWGMQTQSDADARVLSDCEKARQSTMPACQLLLVPGNKG